jgi:hypothetical protein
VYGFRLEQDILLGRKNKKIKNWEQGFLSGRKNIKKLTINWELVKV